MTQISLFLAKLESGQRFVEITPGFFFGSNFLNHVVVWLEGLFDVLYCMLLRAKFLSPFSLVFFGKKNIGKIEYSTYAFSCDVIS